MGPYGPAFLVGAVRQAAPRTQCLCVCVSVCFIFVKHSAVCTSSQAPIQNTISRFEGAAAATALGRYVQGLPQNSISVTSVSFGPLSVQFFVDVPTIAMVRPGVTQQLHAWPGVQT
jgi:hypothetical protein